MLQTGWLVLGVTLLLALGLEGAYRLQGAVRGALRGSSTTQPQHPNAAEAWWPAWVEADGAVNGPGRYDPYRAWWARPFASRWVHVDSRGERITVPTLPLRPARRILFLGGSVMWGYTVPDSLTIPSLVQQGLLARGDSGNEIRNLAQPSFNATQGLITLVLELRAGYRPDVVVSLDGNNDVLVQITDGHPGAAFGEAELARRSAVGTRGFLASLAGLTRYSALLTRLTRMVLPYAAVTGQTSGPPSCDSTASYYTAVVDMAESLGSSHRFGTLFLWQPHPSTSRKRLTPFEQGLKAEPGFAELMRACTATVERTMAAGPRSGFVSLTPMFDGDTASVFLDAYGHLTPEGHRRIAAAILSRLPAR